MRTFTLLLVLFALSCGKDTSDKEVKKAIRPVQYAIIGSGHNHGNHTFNGVAQAEKQANLSFKVGGNIRSLNVKVGDQVRQGQLLATIDASDYAIQADQAKASNKGAEAQVKTALTQLQIAKSTYNRIERLYENGSVSVAEFDQAKSQYDAAKSQLEAAQTQVESASKQAQAAYNQVTYTQLTAPYSGIITQQMMEVNELANAGTPIFKISSTGNPEINVGIPENYISRVEKGLEVNVAFSVMGEKVYKGHVSEISYATQGGTTYPTTVKLDEENPAIRPGMAATVSFNFGHDHDEADHEKVVAPMNAVGEDQNGNFVFILQKEGEGSYKVVKTAVKVGDMDEDGFEIIDGLKEGDYIATAGLSSLLDGMTVKLLN